MSITMLEWFFTYAVVDVARQEHEGHEKEANRPEKSDCIFPFFSFAEHVAQHYNETAMPGIVKVTLLSVRDEERREPWIIPEEIF